MRTEAKPIPRRELLAYQADVKGSIFRQIRQRFARLKECGFTQKDLADLINMDRGQLSRRLRGDYDLKLETLSDLARGLDCRIDVRLTPLTDLAASIKPSETEDKTITAKPPEDDEERAVSKLDVTVRKEANTREADQDTATAEADDAVLWAVAA